jgi:hypothetical protein
MTQIRRFAKTPRAWEALALPDLVGRNAHTLLLMANGRRSTDELSLLMGDDITDLAESLMAQGYLTDALVKVASDMDEDAAADA